MHIALLGDSILDNKAYTQGEPDVAAHLRGVLPPSDLVTLCAIDGAATMPQLESVSAGASHIVLSLGGNDALMNLDMLSVPVTSTAEAMFVFRDRILHKSHRTVRFRRPEDRKGIAGWLGRRRQKNPAMVLTG